MARPKSVNNKDLALYTQKHTRKISIKPGFDMTVLHLIKETKNYYISIESWSIYCRQIKALKSNFAFDYNLPLLDDTQALESLNNSAWIDYVSERKKYNSDLRETISLIEDLFQGKTPEYIFKLDQFIHDYLTGNFSDNPIATKIGSNAILIPYAFSSSTSSDKITYEHAGDILLINTPEKVFFTIVRHF